MKAKVNRANITRHLIEYQLDMVGKRLVDTLDDDMWYFNWTMNQEQHEEFKRYAIPLLKKIFKFNKGRAEQTFDWFNLQFGLRIKN
jgi:CRISPR/Cas system endoribonuclease Cas6 (RAMP superfamily)